MAYITPTINVTPENQPQLVTDPELIKQLNASVIAQKDNQVVTDPELIQQLNAQVQAQPQIKTPSVIPPEMLQGEAAGPGDTSIADFLVHPIDTLTGRDKVSDQSLSDLVTGQEPSGGNHPFLGATAKGIMNFKSMMNDNFISEILPLIEDHKKQYGPNYEKATPEQRKDFINSENELALHLNKQAQYNKDVEAVTKKYGTDDFSKKADSLYSKPEFQNASTLHKFQMYGDLVLSNPQDIPGHIATVSLESLPTSLTSIVAAVMANFMKLGPSGAAYAGGSTSGLTEFASQYVAMRQEGLSHEEATMKAGVKSTFIGNMDTRSFNSSGKALDRIMGQVDKGIVKRVLSTAKETAKELNKQGMYGASGEILGSIASGQKVDPRAALDEYFGELATGPLEALTTYRGKLADERAAGAEPAPPGGGAPPAPPTPGAIIDTSEFDQADIPGTPPTTPPPPPATPAAEPEKTPEVTQAIPIPPELQAKVDEYSETLKKYDPVAYTHMMADINDGLVKSEDDLKEYKRSYSEIQQAQQKRQEFVNNANEIIEYFKTKNPPLARQIISDIENKKFTNIGDLSEYRRNMNEMQMRQQMMLDKIKKKPIEDKEVEAEAFALVDELEKYNKNFAAGFRSAVENGNIQSMDQLELAKNVLAKSKAQSGEEGKSSLNETFDLQKFYEDSPIQWKNRQKALQRATPELKDLYDRTNNALQNLTSFFNQNGYSMYDSEASRSDNKIVSQLSDAKSYLLADIQQALIKSERITSRRLQLKPIDPKDILNLDLRTAATEKLIAAINNGISGQDITDQMEAAQLENIQKELNQTRQEEQRTKASQKETETKIAIPKVTTAKEMVKALGGENAQQLRDDMNPTYNYTSKDGVEVTFKEEGKIFDLVTGDEDTQVGSDVHLDYIGSKDKNKGLASKELDKIIKMADANDLSISIQVSKQDKDGLTNKQLKDWYQRKGFIFPRKTNIGYRPRPNEKLIGYPEKTIKVPLDKIKEVEDQINSDLEGRTFSDEETFFAMFGNDRLKQGYQMVPTEAAEEGYDEIFYFDGTSKPARVDNIHARYDYKTNRVTVSQIGAETEPLDLNPASHLDLAQLENQYKKSIEAKEPTKLAQKKAEPEVKDETKQAVRYDPSTDKYTGDVKLGDTVSDGKDNFIVTRRSGYLLEVDKVTPEGKKVYGSINVDPTSTEFKGDLYKVAEAPKIKEKKPEEKEDIDQKDYDLIKYVITHNKPLSKFKYIQEGSQGVGFPVWMKVLKDLGYTPEIKPVKVIGGEERYKDFIYVPELDESINQEIKKPKVEEKPAGELESFPKDIQDRLKKLHRLATLAEKKVMDKPLTMDDVVNAYNRVEDSKKEENLANTEKNFTKQAEDKLLIKIDKEYVNQFQIVPPKRAGLIAAIRNGSLDISKQEWAKDAYDIFKIKEVKLVPKLKGVSDPVAEQLNKFNAGDYRLPEKIKGKFDDAQSKKEAEVQNDKNLKVYQEAAKLFLEGPLDAKPATYDKIDLESFEQNSIQPQPIEKKSTDKVITNAEEQNKVLAEIIDLKDVRYYLGGIFVDRANDRMVTTDGHRATFLKKPDFSNIPDKPEKITGDSIYKLDGTWIDGKYPAIDRILPESHAENKTTVNAKDLGDYARGVEKANKFLSSEETLNIFLEKPDAAGTFNAKYIRQMADLFRKFGYKNIIISLDEGKKLFATSPDGKLSHIVMGMVNPTPIFKQFSKIFKVEKAKGARGDGQTIQAIKDRIIREFGRSVQQLFKDGLIVVVNTVAELDPKYQNELDANDKAFFDKETGVAYIIADRVSAGDVRSVVLHEVGEHYGLRGMLGEKVYNEQLNNLKKQKDRDIIVAKAWEHVTKNYANLLETDEMQFLREVMARIGENAPTHNLFQRIKTAIKAFLVKKGIIKNLTGEELQDLVMRSLHTVVKGRRVLSSGTGLESARGPSDPDAKRELDDEFRANDVPDAPFNNQKDISDKLTENIKEAKKVIRDVAAAPKQSGIKMISGLDQALTTFRIKNVFFGAGIEETEARKYAGKLIDAMGKAIASVSLTNAIHAGHIAANVMRLGKLTFNQGTQMFQAARSAMSMDNIFRLERKLFKKLGKQTATNLINTFFEAKRARSIQNEFLNREAELERAINDGEDPEVAQRNYDAIVKAYKKIPEYFQRRDSNGDLMFMDVIENGEIVDQLPILNDDVIDDYINKDQDFPELREIMDNWTAVNHNMLDNMVFAGIISAKRGASLKSIKDYVPWFRVQDGAEELHAPSSFVAGLTNISKERVFRKGAVSARIDNMIDNMVYNIMMMTRNSIRNYSALQIAKAYATRKPNGKLQVFAKEGVMPDGAVRTNILVNGRRIIIEIKDPNHAAALMGLENLELPILDVLSSFSQGLRRGVTTNPFFQWWQVWKDAPTAAAVTGLKGPLKVWARILGSFFMALNPNDPIVQTLKSYGIGGFQSSGRTAEKEVNLTRGLALMDIGPWILKILDHVGDASDYAQRRIIYQEVLKQGGTEMEALFAANAVIDFLRHGNSKAALGLVRTVTFMNAYIQQIDVLATSMAGGGFKRMDRKKAKARFWKTTRTLVAVSLLYVMMKGGDDDYEKIDDQTKMRNFIIGNFKIPINTSYGFMFKALPEMIYNYIIKHGTDNAIDETRLRDALMKAAYDSLLGPNPIATGLKAPVEIILNHDFFTGGTVTPKGMENLDAYMQYTSSTSNLGKLFSNLTLGTLNPIEADHLMRGLFGTVGSTAGWLSDMFTSDKPERVWARNPIIGQVFLPPEPRGREDLFYELKERSDKSYNTWETLNKRGREAEAEKYFDQNKLTIMVHDYIVNAEAGLKEINAEIRRLSDDPRLTPAEKREQITIFQQQKNDILESVNQERLRAERAE